MAWQYQCRFVSDDGAPTTSRLLEEIVSNEMIRQPMRRGEFLGQLLASLLLNSIGVPGVCVCLWGAKITESKLSEVRGWFIGLSGCHGQDWRAGGTAYRIADDRHFLTLIAFPIDRAGEQLPQLMGEVGLPANLSRHTDVQQRWASALLDEAQARDSLAAFAVSTATSHGVAIDLAARVEQILAERVVKT